MAMGLIQLVDLLIDICKRQNDVIRAQAFALSQYDTSVCEEEAEWARRKLDEICDDWESDTPW